MKALPVALVVAAGIVASAAILILAGGEDAGPVAAFVAVVFGAGVIGALLADTPAVRMLAAAQTGAAVIFSGLAANDAGTAAANASLVAGAIVSLLAIAVAVGDRVRGIQV